MNSSSVQTIREIVRAVRDYDLENSSTIKKLVLRRMGLKENGRSVNLILRDGEGRYPSLLGGYLLRGEECRQGFEQFSTPMEGVKYVEYGDPFYGYRARIIGRSVVDLPKNLLDNIKKIVEAEVPRLIREEEISRARLRAVVAARKAAAEAAEAAKIAPIRILEDGSRFWSF